MHNNYYTCIGIHVHVLYSENFSDFREFDAIHENISTKILTLHTIACFYSVFTNYFFYKIVKKNPAIRENLDLQNNIISAIQYIHMCMYLKVFPLPQVLASLQSSACNASVYFWDTFTFQQVCGEVCWYHTRSDQVCVCVRVCVCLCNNGGVCLLSGWVLFVFTKVHLF